MTGKLIVFEGGEGCGKTTQVQRLYGWLLENEFFCRAQAQGSVAGVKLTREPGGTEIGKKIRHLLLNQGDPESPPILSKTELLLYAADRAQHVEEMLQPWLAQGYWVVCDRYTDSTVAYQGYGRQLDIDLINQLNQLATGGLKSDLTLWLNVSPEVGLARMRERGEADRIEQASQDFHQRVAAGFAVLAESGGQGDLFGDTSSFPLNFMSSGPTVEIDGAQSVEVVAAKIQSVVQARLGKWYPEVSEKFSSL